ncbi:MAG: lipid-A-disaccharide synthase [Planctomycetaceae bacterium]|jgi:lipid-A-disaccharide synthase|nr:lipid-A-disaccharide synthase [Planctomycetaceae bacterium]
MRFFFSAGEPSGDIHAAALINKIRELLPDAEFIGFGGTQMQKAGCQLLFEMTTLAFMGIVQVITNYFLFRNILNNAKKYFKKYHVDAVILVDYPGFNWHVARAAKEQGIPVFYFMPPQLWSWASWRVRKMKKWVDWILCPLPFEERWFRQHGCQTVYIGHPFFEEIRNKISDPTFLESFYPQYGNAPILTLLPGSRTKEVMMNLDDMLLTVEYIRSLLPKVRPVFSPVSIQHAEYIQKRLNELEISIPIFVGHTQELIRAADCCLAVSGSVSLELLACNKPTVIYYRVGMLPFLIQRFFRRTRYITLVNLLGIDRQPSAKNVKRAKIDKSSSKSPNKSLSPIFYDDSTWFIPSEPSLEDRNRMFFPEFLTATDRSKDAAAYFIHWLSNPAHLAIQKRSLALLLRNVDQIESPLNQAAQTILRICGL